MRLCRVNQRTARGAEGRGRGEEWDEARCENWPRGTGGGWERGEEGAGGRAWVLLRYEKLQHQRKVAVACSCPPTALGAAQHSTARGGGNRTPYLASRFHALTLPSLPRNAQADQRSKLHPGTTGQERFMPSHLNKSRRNLTTLCPRPARPVRCGARLAVRCMHPAALREASLPGPGRGPEPRNLASRRAPRACLVGVVKQCAARHSAGSVLVPFCGRRLRASRITFLIPARSFQKPKLAQAASLSESPFSTRPPRARP